jgi:hypothetical protein
LTFFASEVVAGYCYLSTLFFRQYTYLPADQSQQKLCLSRLRNMDYHRRLYKKAVVCQRDHLINIAKTQRTHADASLQPLTMQPPRQQYADKEARHHHRRCTFAVAGITFRVMDASFAMSIKMYDCDRRAKAITVRQGSLRKGDFPISFSANSKGQDERSESVLFFPWELWQVQISAVATMCDDGEGSIRTRMSDDSATFRVGGAAILSESSIVDLVSRNNILLSS